MGNYFFCTKRNFRAHALSVTGMERAREKEMSKTPMQDTSHSGLPKNIRKQSLRKKYSQGITFKKLRTKNVIQFQNTQNNSLGVIIATISCQSVSILDYNHACNGYISIAEIVWELLSVFCRRLSSPFPERLRRLHKCSRVNVEVVTYSIALHKSVFGMIGDILLNLAICSSKRTAPFDARGKSVKN